MNLNLTIMEMSEEFSRIILPLLTVYPPLTLLPLSFLVSVVHIISRLALREGRLVSWPRWGTDSPLVAKLIHTATDNLMAGSSIRLSVAVWISFARRGG
jgi:hypothetical protein